MEAMTHAPIDRYGIIGDLETVALVGMDASIDFCCFPRFDSPTIFAKLLDEERGGSFLLAPAMDDARHKQLYLPDTNVLLSRFLAMTGVAEVSDFMPVEEGGQRIIRRAKAVRGELRFRMVCDPKFDYGRTTHEVILDDQGALFVARATSSFPAMTLRLRAPLPLEVEGGAAVCDLVLRAGESATFVLEQVFPGIESPSVHPSYTVESFKRTSDFWRRWIGRSSYRGRWRETVNRSALTLKLLTSKRYGSIIAAPTFGLPEHIGGIRNWDYRYSWIRDSSFTLYGLMRLGFTDEAAAFMRWIEARCDELNPDGSLQIMYGVDGRHDLPEEELAHFRGYMGSSPVRVGNGACRQLQLDIYGELMDSVYLYDKYGQPISHDLWANLRRLVDWVCEHWREADEGIWETRGGRREFLFSRVMCWAAVDRAVRLARKRSFPAPMVRWRRVRDAIYSDIFANFWSEKRRAFVQARGSESLDASMLLMPLIKFISPTDPRWLSTLAAIETDLVDDSLVYRYRTHEFTDGLVGEEGTFCICSFWFTECLARAGDLDKARYYFEKMLGYANHLGLFPEEIGPAGEHLGNFPQAFTHLGLISAAYFLDRALNARGAPR